MAVTQNRYLGVKASNGGLFKGAVQIPQASSAGSAKLSVILV
jgi:hypothetical protein